VIEIFADEAKQRKLQLRPCDADTISQSRPCSSTLGTSRLSVPSRLPLAIALDESPFLRFLGFRHRCATGVENAAVTW